MKITASYILHYGREYLYWSMKSVAKLVDEIRIFYTPVPSHGHGTQLKNPETKEELEAIVNAFREHESTSVYWHEARPGSLAHEGIHRNWAIESCKQSGADIVVVVDADELWDTVCLANAISTAIVYPQRSFRIGMRHFWRSVWWVCDDPAMPTRIIKPQVPEHMGEEYLSGQVYHMGYAQSPEIIYYKQAIHGHKGEWRQDWFDNTFMAWKPGVGDVHPTNVNFWTPQPIHDFKLKYLLEGHPYLSLDIIEHPIATQNPYIPAG